MRLNSFIFAAAVFCAASLVACKGGESGWQESEKTLIQAPDSVMRVLTVDNEDDLIVLRGECSDFTAEELCSELYSRLAWKMVATVTSPEQDGVGIAGPQVGLSRRIVAVKRYDKEGSPFEVYPNIRIIERRGEKELGPEGCLSVPGRRGEVERWRDIDISYTDPQTLETVVENVTGFTAVIFQHETDHLDGVLYIDYL